MAERWKIVVPSVGDGVVVWFLAVDGSLHFPLRADAGAEVEVDVPSWATGVWVEGTARLERVA